MPFTIGECLAAVCHRDLMNGDGSSRNSRPGHILDGSGNFSALVERSLIMLNLEVDQAATGFAHNASRTDFNVDSKVVSVVKLSVRTSAADTIKTSSSLIPAGRLDVK